MSLVEHPPLTQSLDEYAMVAQPLEPSTLPSKKPWIPPQLMLMTLPSISNNVSGGGDGDSALAHS